MPNRWEVARLLVGGFTFEDWTSVYVQHRYGEPFAIFQFTCAEREPYINIRELALRFEPDDPCFIFLATDQLAMNGTILTRQVSYDATNHGVQLQGKGNTWGATKSSVESQNGTGNFDGKSISQVFSEVFQYYPVGTKFIGDIDNTPFKNLQNQPGEITFDFVERLARHRGAILGSDHLGNMLLIGDHPMPIVERLVEGVNIKACQCIITKDQTLAKYSMLGSTGGSDDKMGTDASEQMASAPGSAKTYSHKIVPTEQPVWNIGELAKRAANEALWHEAAMIECHITVNGWVMSNGRLWRVGDVVWVKSPMAPLDQPLAIETATFTQDNSAGTKTELKLVRPELLRIRPKFSLAGTAPEATTPPAGTVVPVPPPGGWPNPPLPPGTSLNSKGEITEPTPLPAESPRGWSGGADTQSPRGWGG